MVHVGQKLIHQRDGCGTHVVQGTSRDHDPVESRLRFLDETCEEDEGQRHVGCGVPVLREMARNIGTRFSR